MLELNTSMPLLPGAAFGRKPFQVELDELDRTTGTPGSAFRIHAGDVIVFPDSTPYVVGIRINDKVDSPIAYYIAVKRNGENSWLDLGILTRTDADGKPLGKFQEQMLSLKTYRERLNFLRGRTIEGGELRTHEFQVFKDGQLSLAI